ncbi:MAG: hypothetical protein COB93_09290 [Sneathiella sp.]|nr:MAG: hypothetical protein COB93_09290 [Sneathiella sp.]
MNWMLKQILVGREGRQTIAKYATGADQYLGVGLVLSAAALGLALTAPAITTTGYLGLMGTYSLLDMIMPLMKGGQGNAAIFIVVVALLLPIIFLSSAFEVWYKHELQGDKFERKAARLRQYGKLWFLEFAALLFGLYTVLTADADIVLHLPVYYLMISLGMQKLVFTRLSLMIASVKYVEDEEG